MIEDIQYSEKSLEKIPKEWKVVQLIDTVEKDNDIIAGPFGSNLKVSDYRNEGIPIIRLQNIERNQFINKDIKYISPAKAKELNYHSFKSGDVVLAKLGDPIGKTCIVPDFLKEGIVVADVVRIRVSSGKAVKKFIEYILNSSICSNQLRRETIGSTRPRVNISQIRNLVIPFPPLPEQEKIVEILYSIDNAIQKSNDIITRTEKLKKGLIQKLLTKGIGHEEFKDTEIGRVPKEWEVVKFVDVCNQRNEMIIPSRKGEYKFVGLEHVISGKINLQNHGLDTDVKSSKFKFYKGDILYGKLRPYLDKAILTSFEGICSTDLLVLTSNQKKALSEFLIYLIHSKQFIQHAISTTSGTNHPRTSWKAISKYEFALPPISEQLNIFEFLSTVDKKLEIERKRKKIFETIKKGLMNDLLTGKKRVKITV